jgi:hypothetical protein
MTSHLTHDQLCDVLLAGPSHLLGSKSEAAQSHLSSCALCAAELAELRTSISLFRDTTAAYAEHTFTLLPAGRPGSAPSPRAMIQPAYWAAAATLFVAIAIPAGLHLRRPVHPSPTVVTGPGQTAESDEALMEAINQHISVSVPTPMQALADPTDGTTSEKSNSPQKEN